MYIPTLSPGGEIIIGYFRPTLAQQSQRAMPGALASPFCRANSSMRSCSTWSCSPSAAVRAVKAISLLRHVFLGEKSAGNRGFSHEIQGGPVDVPTQRFIPNEV